MSSALAGGNEAAAMRSAAQQAAPQSQQAAAGVPKRSLPPWAAQVARYAPVLLPAAVMAVAGLWGLARDSSMGNDEVATRWAALLSLRDLAHLVRHVDAVHGLYYLLMHAWVAVGGASPTALRVPSVIAMVIAVALVSVLARQLTGSGWVALFAGLIMALTPSISFYAQTARSYAMVLAGVVAATLVLVQALRAETATVSERSDSLRLARRWWIGYAVLVAISSYLNEMALLMLAAHGVTVLLSRPGRRIFQHWLYAAIAGGVVVLPLLALSVAEHGAIGWIPPPGIPAAKTLFHDYFGAATILAVLVFACAVVAVLPGWTAEPVPQDGSARAVPPESGQAPAPWWRGGVSLPSVAAPLLVLPALLLAAESRVLHPLYVDRYVLYGEAGAALLAGAGVYRIGQWVSGRLAAPGARRVLVVLPGVVLCVLALVLQLGPDQRVRTPQSRAYDFGGPSRYVGAHARAGDGVLYFDTFFRKAELGYPQDFSRLTDFAVAVPPRQAGNFRGTDKTFAATLPLMLGYQRIWVIGARPSASLRASLLRQQSQALAQDFTRIDTQTFKGITVTLWQRR
ncbi:MAG TPA: glycosyltransferase family 39 protein [Streptosporangiaceae bacterium]|nr:glycosyltransferase family 39 protein [Streptosporangiaceae bacterium]